MRRVATATLLMMAFWFPSDLFAQQDFATSTLKPGDFVFVTVPSGTEVSGRVTDVSAARIRLDGLEFEPEPDLLIERRGDSVWDGAWKGLLVGSVATFTIAAANGTDMNDMPALLAYFAVPHMFWGAAVDWLHTGRTTVFRGEANGWAVRPGTGIQIGASGISFVVSF